jgi:hypothetical protein
MNSRTIELALSRSNIVDQVASLLYATGVVYDNENISNIQFGAMNEEIVPIKVSINKPQEVQHIIHNG